MAPNSTKTPRSLSRRPLIDPGPLDAPKDPSRHPEDPLEASKSNKNPQKSTICSCFRPLLLFWSPYFFAQFCPDFFSLPLINYLHLYTILYYGVSILSLLPLYHGVHSNGLSTYVMFVYNDVTVRACLSKCLGSESHSIRSQVFHRQSNC